MRTQKMMIERTEMYFNRTNIKVREALSKVNKPLHWLASILNKSEATISRMMRQELPEEEQLRIVALIEAAKDGE